uniref:flagellar protein export ATPase FliI n=1 Tax=Polynucleobacter sp. TaxID=2029855 RepID=UPI004048B332
MRNCSGALSSLDNLEVAGRVNKVTGLVIEAGGIYLPIGSICLIPMADGQQVEAEVVGFDHGRLFLMPQSNIEGIAPEAKVILKSMPVRHSEFHQPFESKSAASKSVGRVTELPVGDHLLGRVLDASGVPLDDLGPLKADHFAGLQSAPINPLKRAPIDTILDVGVKAINGLLTVGRGQRMGLFAGSGVGKSVLLGMMARYTDADVIVVGLIGERGREVKEFIENILGEVGLARSVVVAAPADASPLMRLQGANYSATIAEHFRSQGKHVLLIMDSLTRFAMAQREIALALGEPPATKGYPPSVFAKLPKLVERAGNSDVGGGSITAFYTVLTEGDDQQDPIADSARAILDGHIVLDRTLAEAGHYPAIDIEQSISRVMHSIVGPEHQLAARKLKQLSSKYTRNQDLINVGAYSTGSDAILDEAINKRTLIESFLQQDFGEQVNTQESILQLSQLISHGKS